jgi:hypothetical protein
MNWTDFFNTIDDIRGGFECPMWRSAPEFVEELCSGELSTGDSEPPSSVASPVSATPQIEKKLFIWRSRDSSGSIVSDYGLDERGSNPNRGRGFFF